MAVGALGLRLCRRPAAACASSEAIEIAWPLWLIPLRGTQPLSAALRRVWQSLRRFLFWNLVSFYFQRVLVAIAPDWLSTMTTIGSSNFALNPRTLADEGEVAGVGHDLRQRESVNASIRFSQMFFRRIHARQHQRSAEAGLGGVSHQETVLRGKLERVGIGGDPHKGGVEKFLVGNLRHRKYLSLSAIQLRAELCAMEAAQVGLANKSLRLEIHAADATQIEPNGAAVAAEQFCQIKIADAKSLRDGNHFSRRTSVQRK